MALIKQLAKTIDGVKTSLFPVTLTKAVYDEDGTSLDTTIEDIKDSVENINFTEVTKAEYDALTPLEKSEGNYIITDEDTVNLTASTLPYDENTSTKTKIDTINNSLTKVHYYKSDVTEMSVNSAWGGGYTSTSRVRLNFGKSISNPQNIQVSYISSDGKNAMVFAQKTTDTYVEVGLYRATTATVNGTIYMTLVEA